MFKLYTKTINGMWVKSVVDNDINILHDKLKSMEYFKYMIIEYSKELDQDNPIECGYFNKNKELER